MDQTVTEKIERARAYLAATVTLTPATDAADLLDAAAQCRAHLASVLGSIPQRAEQAARSTAAGTTLADYQCAAETADVADRAMWAARLADMLGYVLDAPRTGPAALDVPEAPPVQTERQARQLPAARAVYAAFEADPGPGKMTPHSRAILAAAFEAADVELGAYDRFIADWLATWEPATCAVVAGWITRAAAGREAGR